MKELKLTHQQEKIVNILNGGMASPKQLAEMLGKGYTEQKVQSMVLTLARKGQVDKTKAAILLRGTPMIKFLNYGYSSNLSGSIPAYRR